MAILERFQQYASSFGCDTIYSADEFRSKGGSLYALSSSLHALLETLQEDVFSAGLFLGTLSPKGIIPSRAFLEHIAKHTSSKITVTGEGAWLFVCGRDVFSEHLVRTAVPLKTPLIVCGDYGRVLGTGVLLKREGRLFLKHTFDIGWYVRREQ